MTLKCGSNTVINLIIGTLRYNNCTEEAKTLKHYIDIRTVPSGSVLDHKLLLLHKLISPFKVVNLSTVHKTSDIYTISAIYCILEGYMSLNKQSLINS